TTAGWSVATVTRAIRCPAPSFGYSTAGVQCTRQFVATSTTPNVPEYDHFRPAASVHVPEEDAVAVLPVVTWCNVARMADGLRVSQASPSPAAAMSGSSVKVLADVTSPCAHALRYWSAADDAVAATGPWARVAGACEAAAGAGGAAFCSDVP